MTPMVKEKVIKTIQALHNSPYKIVAICAGAGAGLQQLIWEVPGATKTIINMHFPYDYEAISQTLGKKPERYVNKEIAIEYATRAYYEGLSCLRTSGDTSPVIGLGLTASVATSRQRAGDDRVHVACKLADHIVYFDIVFDKGILGRIEQGEICDLLAVHALAAAIPGTDIPLPQIPMYGINTDQLNLGRAIPFKDIYSTNLFEQPVKVHDKSYSLDYLKQNCDIIYPVTANPLHEGHIQLAQTIMKNTGKRVAFMICTRHPEKGRIDNDELVTRLKQFYGVAPVIVHNESSLYMDMLERFSGYSFVLGADAIKRMFSRVYLPSENDVEEYMKRLINAEAHIYVAGRVIDNKWVSAQEAICNWTPQYCEDRFTPVLFRRDVSSTELRK